MNSVSYRLVVGENGSEVGHVLPCKAKTTEGALRSLKKAMKPYKGDGWGRVEYTTPTMMGWDYCYLTLRGVRVRGFWFET